VELVQGAHLVHRNEHLLEKSFVFGLEWHGQTADNRTEHFEQLLHAVMPFAFVHKIEEDAIQATPDVRPE